MTKKIRSLMSILWIGLFAGTLDISENLIFNGFRGITPWRVFQYARARDGFRTNSDTKTA